MSRKQLKNRKDKKQQGTGIGQAARNRVSGMLRSSHLRLAVGLILTCVGLYGIVTVLPEPFTRPINEDTARTLGLVLNAFGIPALTVGDIVCENSLAFKIIPECTPIFTAGLFLSFVAFYPVPLRQKTTGLALGIPILYLGNIVRLTVTFLVSRYNRNLFEILHVYLGQVFTLFLVILCCLLWMKWVEKGEAKQGGTMKTVYFLARFGLISAGVFLVWIRVHHGYIGLLDRLMVPAFSLFGFSVRITRETAVYYETFSIVTVVSLVLAAQSVPWHRRISLLCAGLGILFLTHLFHRIDNVLMVFFRITAVQSLDLATLVIGQYLLPVLILIYLIKVQRQNVPVASHIKSFGRKKI